MLQNDAAKRITFLSQWKHFSHKDIAKEIGLDRGNVCAIALGEREIDDESAVKLEELSKRFGYDELVQLGD